MYKDREVFTPGPMTKFETGATRSADEDKLDFEGFLSPLVLERYAQYLHKHRKQADGVLRASDNWQKGMPMERYVKSALRHLIDWWKQTRGFLGQDEIEDSACGILFNVMGWLHERLKNRQFPFQASQAKQYQNVGLGGSQDGTQNSIPATIKF